MAPCSVDITRNRDLYPDFKAFMTALQDPGREDKKSKERKIVYPKLTKVCGKMYDKLKLYPESAIGLGGNRSRDIDEMVRICLKLRKHTDVHEVHEKFREFAAGASSEKVFIIVN